MPTPTQSISFLCLATLGMVSLLTESPVAADDWIAWPSTYTHEPISGQRVDQYQLAAQPVAPYQADFVRSGYRNYRSTLQAGQSADNMHIVEQWGRPVVPYEQWRFPYRPYAVPYEAWGPQLPYGIYNGTFGGGAGNWGWGNSLGRPGPWNQGSGEAGFYRPPNSPGGFPLTPQYHNEPWYDGSYPTAPPLGTR